MAIIRNFRSLAADDVPKSSRSRVTLLVSLPGGASHWEYPDLYPSREMALALARMEIGVAPWHVGADGGKGAVPVPPLAYPRACAAYSPTAVLDGSLHGDGSALWAVWDWPQPHDRRWAMYREGWRMGKIAEAEGVSINTVRRSIKRRWGGEYGVAQSKRVAAGHHRTFGKPPPEPDAGGGGVGALRSGLMSRWRKAGGDAPPLWFAGDTRTRCPGPHTPAFWERHAPRLERIEALWTLGIRSCTPRRRIPRTVDMPTMLRMFHDYLDTYPTRWVTASHRSLAATVAVLVSGATVGSAAAGCGAKPVDFSGVQFGGVFHPPAGHGGT